MGDINKLHPLESFWCSSYIWILRTKYHVIDSISHRRTHWFVYWLIGFRLFYYVFTSMKHIRMFICCNTEKEYRSMIYTFRRYERKYNIVACTNGQDCIYFHPYIFIRGCKSVPCKYINWTSLVKRRCINFSTSHKQRLLNFVATLWHWSGREISLLHHY